MYKIFNPHSAQPYSGGLMDIEEMSDCYAMMIRIFTLK